MNRRTLIGALVFLIVEAAIIAFFIHYWPADREQGTMVLDIIVSTIVWTVLSIDIFRPLADLSESQPRQVGSLGIRWFVTIIYAVVAIGIMVAGHLYEWSPFGQVVIQAVAVASLIAGLSSAAYSAKRVAEVAESQAQTGSGRAAMATAMAQLREAASLNDNIPPQILDRIRHTADEVRYVVPNNSSEAASMEKDFTDTANHIRTMLGSYAMNEEAVMRELNRLDLTLEDRKRILQ